MNLLQLVKTLMKSEKYNTPGALHETKVKIYNHYRHTKLFEGTLEDWFEYVRKTQAKHKAPMLGISKYTSWTVFQYNHKVKGMFPGMELEKLTFHPSRYDLDIVVM